MADTGPGKVTATATGSVIEGAAKKAAPSVSGILSGLRRGATGAAGGVIAGAQRAALSTIDGYVGGPANREAITDAAKTVYGKVSDVFTGEQTIGGLVSEAKEGIENIAQGLVGEVEEMTGVAMGPEGGVDLKTTGLNVAAMMLGNEGSDWGSMSRHLIARIYACDADGIALPTEPLGVRGPVTDVTFDTSLNWQSPFESTGPEAKAPALMAMLQSGSLVPVINAIQAVNPIQSDGINGVLNDAANKARQIARDLEGRTGITKLNSRQVFSGMPPIKVSMTMHFRALYSAADEVMEPYQRLLEFSMPQGLAADGVLTEVIASTGSENSSFIKAMFPSIAPLMVGFVYANNRYPAMVIESISNPLDGPMDDSGRPTYRSVNLVLSTLTAVDRADIKRMFV